MAVAVKELLENAIDAKADAVTIRFVNFGVEKIEVSDNGSGIPENDFEYVCRRHCTSKLESFEDLNSVSTFGFRGEALASLCNICDMIVSTRHVNSELGTEFMVDQSGEIISGQKRPIARNIGTTITLRHLFKSLPVRRKELINNSKKAFQQALQLIHQYSIGVLGLKIACFRKQQAAGVEMNIFTSHGGSIQSNIIEIFDYKTFANLMPIKFDKDELDLESKLARHDYEILEKSGFNLDGFISKPDIGCGKASKDYHYIYLNNRPCEMPEISKNINRIYRLFNRGQYPFVALKIFLDEKLIDRNLTPDKRKVFLSENHTVFKVIQIVLDSLFCRQEADVHSLSSTQIMNSFLSQSPSNTSSQSALKRQNSFSSLNSSIDSEAGDEHNFAVPRGVPPRKLIRYEGGDPTNDHSSSDDRYSMPDYPRNESENETFVTLNEPTPLHSTELYNDDNLHVMNSSFDLQTSDLNGMDMNNVSLISSIHDDDDNADVSDDVFAPYVNKYPGNIVEPEIRPVNNVDSRIAEFNKQNVNNFEKKTTLIQPSLKNHPFFGSMNLPPMRQPQQQQQAQPTEVIVYPKPTEYSLKNQEATLIEQTYESLNESCDNTIFDDFHVPAFEPMNFENNCDEQNFSQESYCIDEPEAEEREVFISNVTFEDIEKQYLDMFKVPEMEISTQKFIGGIDPEKDDDAYQELKMRFSKDDFDNLEVIGQFNLGFIIARRMDNLFIVDQHAVEERRNFERLLSEPKVTTQNLVCPIHMKLSSLNEMIVRDNIEIFTKLGFKFLIDDEQCPGWRMKISQIPVGKDWFGSVQDVEEIVAAIRNSPTGRILSDDISTFVLSGLRREIAYSACRMSIKFGDFLTHTQMKNILGRVSTLRNPFHCAHGRPTIRHLTKITTLQ